MGFIITLCILLSVDIVTTTMELTLQFIQAKNMKKQLDTLNNFNIKDLFG